MGFKYTEQHRDEYFTVGLTVLRGVIPATLLDELRVQTEKGRELARAKNGPQAQRIQPVYAFEELDPRPFREFLVLPEFRMTVEGILGADHTPTENMGVLLEPAEAAWCTAWHRDWLNIEGVDPLRFAQVRDNLAMFNQFNAALYTDHSLWVVPASHNRDDTSEEAIGFATGQVGAPTFPEHLSPGSRELACLDYTRTMPGAEQIVLCAGDVAFYRSSGWHIGNYVPYGKRATLHDGFYADEDRAWWNEMQVVREQARQKVSKHTT